MFGAVYRVTVDDGSCWHGRRDGGPSHAPGPVTLDGCVHRWQW